jgi:signal transduction histidine kinase
MARQANAAGVPGLDRRLPWLAFVLCLVLTAAATAVVGYEERVAENAQFQNSVIDARDRIEARMTGYLALLRGAAGFLSRPEPVNADDFRRFVERVRLREHYPGTLGIGYTHRFGRMTAAEATEQAHRDGFSNVRVWPDTPRDEVHSIVLIEPFDRRNQAALGFDMHSDPVRRKAMDRARDEGTAALSGRVTLVQEIEPAKQPGLLLYVPIWIGGPVPSTVEERRAKLKGYVYAPLRAGDMCEGIFGHKTPRLAFELYDGDAVKPESFLCGFGAAKNGYTGAQVENLTFAGRVWTARFAPALGSKSPFPLVLDVVGLGAVLSLVVFFGIRSREEARARELRAAASELASREMVRFTEMFVGILGHDLRNPLGAISVASQNLLKNEGDERTKETLSRILSSTRRMARMVDQLLDVTRSRLGEGMPVATKPCDLAAIARDVIDEIARARPNSRIELDVIGDLHGTWDPDRMAQVLSNLVGNAVQHSGGAPVSVLLAGRSPDAVLARVHNAGVIAPSFLPVMFEPFRRPSVTPQRPSGGLGLGLYISRSIVDAHGGTIEVSSTEREGTTFTVRLPRNPPPPPKGSANRGTAGV